MSRHRWHRGKAREDEFGGERALELALLHNALEFGDKPAGERGARDPKRLARIRGHVQHLEQISGQPVTDFGNEPVIPIRKGPRAILGPMKPGWVVTEAITSRGASI